MLTDSTIDKSLLQSTIEKEYGIKLRSLTFLPGGEASWGYKVETDNNELYFFKIHKHLTNYEFRFDLTYKLFSAGITHITHPIKTKTGALVTHIQDYPTALFNFIDGFNASEKELDEKQQFAFGQLLGQIHKAKENIGNFALVEDFAYGNAPEFLQHLDEAQSFLTDASAYKRAIAQLLVANKEKILSKLQRLEQLGNDLRSRNLDFVICHGEPHKWNTMVDINGEVYLIDWDDCLFAPKEKDLLMVQDDTIKLEGYKSVTGNSTPDRDILKYYTMEWNISEIDAWSESVLYKPSNDIQNQHAVEELTNVLKEVEV